MFDAGRLAASIRHASLRRSINVAVAALLMPLLVAQTRSQTRDETPVAGVFSDSLPGHDSRFATELDQLATRSAWRTTRIGVAELTNSAALNVQRFDLLILPNAAFLPAVSAPVIEKFLREGGDVIALGAPAWSLPLFDVKGRWLTRDDYERDIASRKPARIIESFDKSDLASWVRHTNDRASQARHEVVAESGNRTLRVVIESLSGWDTFQSPLLENPFPAGQLLTCFRAKGSARTRQLALEWTERDGSRWIATIDLTEEWQNYALPPDAFKPWQPPAGRSGAGDRFNPSNAARFTVGLAQSHTVGEGGRHEYWFDDLGTAPHPFGDAVLPSKFEPPRLESLSPDYLFYPITTPVTVTSANPDRADASPPDSALRTPHSALRAVHPRPSGIGFDQQRPWRWQPVLVARAEDGDYRGAVGVRVAHVKSPFRGGLWACFTPGDAAFYDQPLVQRALVDTLTHFKRGVFLVEGGAEVFTAFENQNVRVGARVANFGRSSHTNLVVRLTAIDRTTGGIAFSNAWSIALASAGEETVERSWNPDAWPDGGFNVTTELLATGAVIDRLSHELHVWRAKANREFVEVRDGGFALRGKPWKAHGVNYLPSTGIGQPDNRYFEHWLGRGAYDPDVIDRDLRRIRGMGMNSVSVFVYHQSLRAQHLLDFLRRCDALGLRVNQSLRPGTPMDFRWAEMKELIEFYRMADNDTIFAYDLAWEPSHFDQRFQEKHYSKLWPVWALKRHGSLSAATNHWKFAPELNGGALSVPPAKLLTTDGPWRRMIADYRAFLDDLLRERYSEARRLVKSIDPNHPVSFRMQFAGDPTHNTEGLMPYDLYGLADAVDIWQPEAYGRVGDWERVKPGRFTADYARLCNPRLPVLWAEMGYSVWDVNRMAPHPDKLAFAARYYADFYRMLTESGVDGVFFWWYPGGFRMFENSDYGILNADGTDRDVTRVIRSEGTRFLAAPKPAAPTRVQLIIVDRDRDARGLFGIYEAVKTDYWRAISEGRQPMLKWSNRPGEAARP